jgi:hypothetical protein
MATRFAIAHLRAGLTQYEGITYEYFLFAAKGGLEIRSIGYGASPATARAIQAGMELGDPIGNGLFATLLPAQENYSDAGPAVIDLA